MNSCLGIIIESDSTDAVSWASSNNKHPWVLDHVHSSIVNFSKISPSLHFQHVLCETNWIAESLAKQGVCRQEDFIAWL